jgi:hypothetical protein
MEEIRSMVEERIRTALERIATERTGTRSSSAAESSESSQDATRFAT